MNVITTFSAKRRERQIKYERKLLKELSIQSLKKSVQDHFGSERIEGGIWIQQGVEEGCYDVAIEAYLLGGQYSRFSKYGESVHDVKMRCENEINHLIDTLYNFWLYWKFGDEELVQESIFYSCEKFVDKWWMEGFLKGEQRRKLRLH
ncbi:YbaK family protein [Heyndrickxia sp. NPDC080065]|uniref:YbaK family protein n=1 Tax=Heyndrickxia sp. NPDC080065 TaxID=3390568 RepID=UPI003D03AD78